MKKYIEILLGGKKYRFLIDEGLDQELKASLNNRYQFNSNDTLIIDETNLDSSYRVKQIILKSILKQISTFDLTPELKEKLNILNEYVDAKSTIYNSDLTKLESILGDASDIYNEVRTNLAKKEVAQEQRENIQENIERIEDVTDKTDYENTNISDTNSPIEDKVSEFKTIIDDISYDETLRNEVPINDIKEAIDRIVICTSMEEFTDKTDSRVGTYDVVNAIKNKNEKIVLPPNTKLEDVVVEVIKTCINDDRILNKAVTYVERKAKFINKTNSALESLRSSLKDSGLSARNLNYFGDQFFDEFTRICNETGTSFEAMFADYFNGYSGNRRYNSPMDKFIRVFNKYNGGDDSTRALLEAMLVKKAIARNLISSRYNNYLSNEYRNLNVNRNGYINVNESSFTRRVEGDISDITSINSDVETDASSHLGLNNHSYETELNMGSKKADESSDKINDNIKDSVSNTLTDAEMLQASLAMNRRNRAKGINGIVTETVSGDLNTTETTSSTRRVNGIAGRPFTSNNALNPALYSEEEETEEEVEDNNLNVDSESAEASNSNNDDSFSDSYNGEENNNNDSNNEDSSGPTDNIATEANDAVKDAAKKGLRKAIIEFIKKNPWVLAIAGMVIFILLVILILVASEGEKKETISYGLGGYPYIQLSNTCESIYVYNTPSGEDGTYPLEEYVAGVVAHEVGAFNNDTMYEVFAIAARTYALRRLQNSSDCSIPGNSTAQVFGKTTNERIIEATNKTRGLVLARDNSLISTEYDAFCWDTKDDNYYNICQKNYDTGEVLKVPVEWANVYVRRITGQVFLDNPRYHSHGRGMSQDGALYLATEQNYTRDQILSFFYGSDAKLMSIYASSYLGEYPINPNDELYRNLDFLVNKSLADLLAEKGSSIEEFNSYLASVVESSGVGTREAVVNVGVSLIGYMAQMGYKLNYQWGGKHYASGVNANWGTLAGTSTCSSYGKLYNINTCLNNYKWSSFDCSGFVNWSLLNGFGLSSFNELSGKGIYSKTLTSNADRIELKADKAVCQAGDVLIKPGSHIVLVVGVDESRKNYIVAESTGSNLNLKTGGVKLSYYSYSASGYFCGDMSSIYRKNNQVEEE